jgi:hypothetical protein
MASPVGLDWPANETQLPGARSDGVGIPVEVEPRPDDGRAWKGREAFWGLAADASFGAPLWLKRCRAGFKLQCEPPTGVVTTTPPKNGRS